MITACISKQLAFILDIFSNEMMIKTENLTKNFNKIAAVDRLSLEIDQGECPGRKGSPGDQRTCKFNTK